ncbi:MAG TPA: hypothetical protein VFF57_01355 [Hanamia sp.]|nr:hypothetical protein [Hanamia sp.]
MEQVYLLWFTCLDWRLNDDEELLIGVYSTIEKAEAAKLRLSQIKGFKDNPSGFEICPYKLDEDNWTEGFSIV